MSLEMCCFHNFQDVSYINTCRNQKVKKWAIKELVSHCNLPNTIWFCFNKIYKPKNLDMKNSTKFVSRRNHNGRSFNMMQVVAMFR